MLTVKPILLVRVINRKRLSTYQTTGLLELEETQFDSLQWAASFEKGARKE